MKTKYDFILGICSMGSISDFTMMSIEQLHLESPYWFKSSFHNYDTIGRARSRIATRFLATNDSNILIFLDTDVGFKPDDITKLVKAVEKGYDIVAGGYIMRDGNTFAIRTWEPLKLDGKIHEVEYVSIVDREFNALESVEVGNTIILVAAWVGKPRLIDNIWI